MEYHSMCKGKIISKLWMIYLLVANKISLHLKICPIIVSLINFSSSSPDFVPVSSYSYSL